MIPVSLTVVAMRSVSSTLIGFNLQDHRIRLFWLLQLASILSFLLWVLAISNLPTLGLIGWKLEARGDQHAAASVVSVSVVSASVESNSVADGSHSSHSSYSSHGSYAKAMAIDTWFSLVSMATLDAFAVMFNFNRGLIVTFHRTVSLRMTVLATFLSAGVFMWQTGVLGFNQLSVVGIVVALAMYLVLGWLIDSIRRPQLLRRGPYAGSLQQYCETLASFDISWPYATLLTATIVAVALVSTMLLPRAYSSISVFIWVIFEAVFLTAMKANRTSRYIVLSGPILLSIACVKWGLEMATSNPRLTMKPEYFLILFVSGRLILDVHLQTILKSRHELQWARKTVLVPTRGIFGTAIALFLLEKAGLRIVTYSKPIMVLLAYGMSCLVIQTPAIYNVAFRKSRVPRRVPGRLPIWSASARAAEFLLRNLATKTG